MAQEIKLGSRVYLKFCIAGDPGCVVGFDRKGKAIVEWVDLDLGKNTSHHLENLVLDEAFQVTQKEFDFIGLVA